MSTLSGRKRSSSTIATRNSAVWVTGFHMNAQCCRTRMTRRSVGSRYSSISRGASTGLLDELVEEANYGLGPVTEGGANALDRTGSAIRLGEDIEDDQRDHQEPDDLLEVHHTHRS